jgi:hypothetical protein
MCFGGIPETHFFSYLSCIYYLNLPISVAFGDRSYRLHFYGKIVVYMPCICFGEIYPPVYNLKNFIYICKQNSK